ncbi:ZN831 protein, partial [Campylorhamphus procurvoides]|nr:ZN831 protein [Campylorhamphus procurvoides]
KTSASSKGAEPAVEGWDRRGHPCTLKARPPALQDTQHSQSSPDNPAYFCHSFGTFYCHALPTHCKEFPVLPPSTQTRSWGSLTVAGTKNSFPSLSAEPLLTWCCLSRSLPLPTEQKGTADSAYSSLHSWHRGASSDCSLARYDISLFKRHNISKTLPYGLSNTGLKTLVSSFSKGQQMQELSPAAPGGAFKNILEQKKRTVVC